MFSFSFITDKKYYLITKVAIKNLITTKIKSSHYKINIITFGIDKLDDLKDYESANTIINHINLDDDFIRSFTGIRHVSQAAYAKFYLPQLVDDDFTLYLDGDIFINRNIENIFDYLNNDYMISAIKDIGHNEQHLLGVNNDYHLFNAGVMLLNLKKMRNCNISEKLISTYNENSTKITNADQSIFNIVFKNEWYSLDISYNMQRIYYTSKAKTVGVRKIELRAAKKNPYIVHFTTHSKPWMFRCAHPFKKRYLKNYKNVIGKIKYDDITFLNLVKKIYEKLQYIKYFLG